MPKRRMASFGGKFLDEFDLPGSESQEAVDLLEEHGFSTRTGFSGQIVFEATWTIRSSPCSSGAGAPG
jgi:hypothetical protein